MSVGMASPGGGRKGKGTVLDIQRVQNLTEWRCAQSLIESYVLELRLDLSFQGLAKELDDFSLAYPKPGGVWLAWREGVAVGCVALRPLGDGAVELKRLYALPQARGFGVGRALVMTALSAARGAGFRAVRLDTVRGMEAAQVLYASLGFVPIPPYRENPLPGAQFLELVFSEAAGSPF
jgi:putative acetyltransferase